MTKPWQIWLVLAAIFATGVGGGWLLAMHVAHHEMRRPPLPPELWVARQIERVAEEVQLTPEEKERIKPIVTANIEELLKVRRQAFDILDRMGKQIAAELTPEQRAKYEKILQEHREARRLMHERRIPWHRPDGAPPEPGNHPPPPPAPPPERSSGT